MKIFSSLLFVAMISVGFLQCKKDDSSSNNNSQANTNNITSSPWVHESSGIDANKNGKIDAGEPTLLSLGVEACSLDNLLTFKKDGTAVADEGATRCNTSAPQQTTFNWSFADNETNLVISNNVFAPLNGKLKIEALTPTNLTLSKDTSLGVFSARILLNLKH